MRKKKKNQHFLEVKRHHSREKKQPTELEADVAPGHGVAQLVLVAQEGHEAHVGLNQDLLVQHHDAVGLPGHRLQDVELQRRLPQLLLEGVDLWTSAFG